jgi:hypothetical protein
VSLPEGGGEPALQRRLHGSPRAVLAGLVNASLNGVVRGLVAQVCRMKECQGRGAIRMVHRKPARNHASKREAGNNRLG